MKRIINLEDIQPGDRIRMTKYWRKNSGTSIHSGIVEHADATRVSFQYGPCVRFDPNATDFELIDRPKPRPKFGDKLLVQLANDDNATWWEMVVVDTNYRNNEKFVVYDPHPDMATYLESDLHNWKYADADR